MLVIVEVLWVVKVILYELKVFSLKNLKLLIFINLLKKKVELLIVVMVVKESEVIVIVIVL